MYLQRASIQDGQAFARVIAMPIGVLELWRAENATSVWWCHYSQTVFLR